MAFTTKTYVDLKADADFTYHSTREDDFKQRCKRYGLPKEHSFFTKNGRVFLKEKFLGAGASAAAHLFLEAKGPEKVVVKTFTTIFYEENKDKFLKEKQVIQRVFGPNYGDTFGDTEPTKKFFYSTPHDKIYLLYLTMPFIAGEEYDSYIKKLARPQEIVQLIIDAIAKVEDVRCKYNIIHGDPNAKNILLAEGRLQLIDFGESECFNQETSQEIIQQALKNEAVNAASLLLSANIRCKELKDEKLCLILGNIFEKALNQEISSVGEIAKILKEKYHPDPAVDHSVLAVDHPVPAVDHSVLAVDHSVPAVDHPVPAVDHSVPAVDHPVPAVDHSVPAVDHPVPAVDNPIPGVEISAIVPHHTLPVSISSDPAGAALKKKEMSSTTSKKADLSSIFNLKTGAALALTMVGIYAVGKLVKTSKLASPAPTRLNHTHPTKP